MVSDKPKIKFKDAYRDYPDEDKQCRFVVQVHFRGKSAHLDLRMDNGKSVIGWTMAAAVEGAIKEPVTTVAEGKLAIENYDWKIDLDSGLFKKRQTNDGSWRTPAIYALKKKAHHNTNILEYEGVIEPGNVGATDDGPGVICIVDNGFVEFGAQKKTYHEYFLHGNRFSRRLVFVSAGTKRDFEERTGLNFNGCSCEAHAESAYWLAVQPKEQVPHVLSDTAIREEWLPPLGTSALPEKIRVQIPEDEQFWKEENQKSALEKRAKVASGSVAFKKSLGVIESVVQPMVDVKKAKRIAYYCVAQPGVPDLQGEVWDADELEKAAHVYMAASRLVDVEHDFKPQDRFQVVEGWVLKEDWSLLDGRNIKKGSFVVGIYFSNQDDFERVLAGKFGGISPAGVKRIAVQT